MATPQWNARHNGILGDASAMENAGDLNQLLGTHAQRVIYPGKQIIGALTAFVPSVIPYGITLSGQDIDQPFTMSGTALGRVVLPLYPVGNGADLLVSLCADNSGIPGAVITQTRIPASWVYQLSAVSAVSVPATTALPIPATQPFYVYTNNPLATGQFNTLYSNAITNGNWPYPTTGSAPATTSVFASYGDYLFQMGGQYTGGSASVVYSVEFNQSTNTVSSAQVQPTLPSANDGSGAAVMALDSSSGNPVLVLAGGATTNGGTATATTYIAPFDPSSGVLSAWSNQAALPYGIKSAGIATYNGYVYVVAGLNTSAAPVGSVVYGLVQNGQITTWSTGPTLPVSVASPYVAAVNGFLIVAGGQNASFANQTTTYYAAINTNGSLGPWLPGPSMPSADSTSEVNMATTAYGVVTSQGQALGVSTAGPSSSWVAASAYGAPVAANPGTWQVFNVSVLSSTTFGLYIVDGLTLYPQISVPLPTTGLTNSATYHLLMQQVSGDANNYLQVLIGSSLSTGTVTVQTSPHNSNNWTPIAYTGNPVPFTAYDNTATSTNALHLWDDNGARITTFVHDTTPDQALIGICEATSMTTAQNANTGFETSLSPWTVTGGTIARSTTQAYEGLYSCQVTPSGSATNVYITSELLPCLPGQSITVGCAAWFTNSVTSNFSMSVNWYTQGQVLISTSSVLVSASAATWTPVSNTFTVISAPSFAYFYSLQPTLSGTPAAGQVFYLDNVIGYPTYTGQQLAGVAQINYTSNQYPNVNPLKATGVTVLA